MVDVRYLNLTHTHTHTRLTALFPGLPRWAGTRKAKPIRILLKQETVSGSGFSWAICTSLQIDKHASTPPLCFLQAGCRSCHPTNSVKALKAQIWHLTENHNQTTIIRDYSYHLFNGGAHLWDISFKADVRKFRLRSNVSCEVTSLIHTNIYHF